MLRLRFCAKAIAGFLVERDFLMYLVCLQRNCKICFFRSVMLACVLIPLALAQASYGEELVIANQGKGDYRIVVSQTASIQDYHAAEVLQQYIAEMTGVALAIISDDNAAVETEIVVGFNKRTDRFCAEIKPESFGDEELQIKTIGQRLFIVGGAPRGVLYGVNSLLTDEWGCRWFAPTIKKIPTYETLVLPQTDRRYEPPFEWRDSFSPSGHDNLWAFHNFQNKDHASLRPEQGGRGGYTHSYLVHTILRLVPPEEHRKSHPEYFWSGPRKLPGGGSALGVCLSRPETAQIAADTLMKLRRQDNVEGDLYYSISAGDHNDWCECSLCNEAYSKIPGNPHGTHWLNFAKRVQDLLKDEPDAPKIAMLAYGYSPVPPVNTVKTDKVGVMYAAVSACQFHAVGKSKCNSDFRQRLRGWLKASDSVSVWLYKVNFDNWGGLFPNLSTLASDLHYLRSRGVRGVFFQGSQAGHAGQRFDSTNNELSNYLIARLMWNPSLKWRELRREFCDAYYGPEAAPVIIKFMDNVRAEFVKQNVHTASVGLPDSSYHWITPQMFARWYAYIDKAESLVTDEEHLRMVRIARLPIMYTEAIVQSNKAGLQTYLDTARSLGAATLMHEALPIRVWAQRKGLEWK